MVTVYGAQLTHCSSCDFPHVLYLGGFNQSRFNPVVAGVRTSQHCAPAACLELCRACKFHRP